MKLGQSGLAAAVLATVLVLGMASTEAVAQESSTAPSTTGTPTEAAQGMTPSVNDDGSTTLEGSVRIGPVCNFVWTTPGRCTDRPYSATVAVQNADGSQQLTQVTSDDTGSFQISLDPGTYLIVPLPPAGRTRPNAAAQLVTLTAGANTTISILYDSGIR
jgi:hypothetical protein